MKRLYALTALLALSGPAMAFDMDVAAVLDHMRPKAQLDAHDVATLMRNSEKWCYLETDGACAWTDIYLEVTDTSTTIEIANAYDADYGFYIVDKAEFRDNRYTCEFDYNWTSSVRLVNRADGTSMGGRDLHEVRQQYENNFGIDDPDCFDYLFVRADAERETITLVQRSFSDYVLDEGSQTLVTLHFDPVDAAALVFAD